MKIIKLLLTRNYLRQILLSISLLLILSILIASFALSYNFERTALHVRHKANMDVLSQMNYNVNYLNDTIKLLANNLYYDTDVQYLRYAQDQENDNYSLIRSIAKLDYTVGSSPFLHSIFIYNANQHKYYVGNGAVRAYPEKIEAALDAVLSQGDHTPKLKLIPIRLSETSGMASADPVDFFAMVMFDQSVSNGIDDAIILNIKPQWLFDNIKQLNEAAGAEGSTIQLLDGAMRVLNPATQERIDMDIVQQGLERKIRTNPDAQSGYVTVGRGDAKSVVGYVRIGVNGWTIINIQPYEAILDDIRSMRITTFWITGCVLLLFVMIAVVVTRRLYDPIDNVLGKFSAGEGSGFATNGIRDEIGYLSDAYASILERFRHANRESSEKRNAVRMYHLKRLVQSSGLISREEFERMTTDNSLQLSSASPYLLAVVKLDRYTLLAKQAELREFKLIQFAVTNITEELVRTAGFWCEVAEMRADHWVVLAGPSEPRQDETTEWSGFCDAIRHVQETVKTYYKLTLTAAVVEPFQSYTEIAARYNEALSLAAYRLLFGYGSQIVPSMVADNVDNQNFDVPQELEKRMMELMKSGELQKLESMLDKYVAHISKFEYEHLIHALLHLAILTRQTVQDMNRNRLQPINTDFGELNRNILTLETLEEIKHCFIAAFAELFGPHSDESNKGNVIIDTIREIVQTQYADLNLSLQSIASMLKMSPVYVGRIFKKAAGLSVAEYINACRLMEAERLLLTSDDSIAEIMDQIGFSNQSQFFKLFKKKCGATPKEYRVTNTFKQL